jgi:hypothetical protein
MDIRQKFPVKEAIKATPPRSRRRALMLRVSLRTILLATAVAGIVLAPISYELSRARRVQREAVIVTAMQGSYTLSAPRRQFSARMALTLWPWKNQYLGRDVEGVGFGIKGSDISNLARVTGVRRINISGPITIERVDFSHPDVQSLHLYADAYKERSDSFAKSRVLSRFPELRELQIARVTPTQGLLDDLGTCRHLRELRMTFDKPFVFGRLSTEVVPVVSLAPIEQLPELRLFHFSKVEKGTDWSFLSRLSALEEVKLTPTGEFMIGGTLESWVKLHGPIPEPNATPLHHLAQLRTLKVVQLYGSPAYTADLEQLLANSPIEELRLDVLPDGLSSLWALKEAKSLRRLHVSVSYFGDSRDAARAVLEGLRIRNLSMGPPVDQGR